MSNLSSRVQRLEAIVQGEPSSDQAAADFCKVFGVDMDVYHKHIGTSSGLAGFYAILRAQEEVNADKKAKERTDDNQFI